MNSNHPAATILIVDDEIQNRKLLEALLRPEGYLTQSAASGEAALASVARCPPDLILLDIMMPGMDGYQVASTLKANPTTAHIPIIMVTASVDRSARLAGLNAGAEDFLTKPVDRAELWVRVRNLLRLKAYGDLLQDNSAILEQQVQERTASLSESESRFREMAENINDVYFLRNVDYGNFSYISPAYEEIFGRSRESLYANPESWVTAMHPDDQAPIYEKFQKGMQAGKSELEFRIVHPDGSIRWAESRSFPVRDVAGKLVRIVTIARDVTERKIAEDRIAYLNRVYAMLSGINTLIVRVRDRDELFREACRIATKAGGFRIAWIGIVDQSAMKIDPAASSGLDHEFVAAFKDDLPLGEGTALGDARIAQVIREKRAFISNDLQKNSEGGICDKTDPFGICSLVILPLIVADEAMGVLVLGAGETGFFQEEEMRLVMELAGDIAFAIDHIGKQERLDYLAYYDVLTGLANRQLFLERVTQYLRGAASGGHKLAMFLIDLERFKNINDSLGRPAGDTLLRQVAEWLIHEAQDANLVARLDVDHFAVVLPEINESDLAKRIEKTMDSLQEHPFHINNGVFRIAAKVGAALFPVDGVSADILFRNAEAALKKAKASGERYLFYTQRMTATVADKLTLENQLRQALDKEEFVLHYQPKVNLVNGKITGAEALIRWNDPRKGLVPPGRFIPILEETGLIYEVGRWALRKAVADCLRWRIAGMAAMRIAVNVSPMQLRNHGFIDEIRQVISVDAHAAAGLELEITESLIMEEVKHNISCLQEIRNMDISIAIDDFGTGFSSLSYLAKLPVDTLKIDRSFVIDMTVGPQGLALVSTIINLAHALELKVVAEGVETEEQSRLLRLMNCDEMQGYLFSKPVPGDIFETKFLTLSSTG